MSFAELIALHVAYREALAKGDGDAIAATTDAMWDWVRRQQPGSEEIGDPSPVSDGGRIREQLRDLAERFSLASRRMSATTGNMMLDAHRAGQRDAYFDAARHVRDLIFAMPKQLAQEAAPGAILSDQPTVLATQWDEIDL